CATAVSLADQGKKVLLVSTDPASNLQDVLDVGLTNDPIAIPSVKNLFACNIDPEASANHIVKKSSVLIGGSCQMLFFQRWKYSYRVLASLKLLHSMNFTICYPMKMC